MQPLPTIQPKEKRIRNNAEASSGISKKSCLQEAQRCPQCTEPVCNSGCPLGIDIPAFIRLLREGNAPAALQKIKEQNEFPSICGRVCLAPCESACVFAKEDAPIGIRALERYAADHGRAALGAGRKAHKPTGKKIAIIGSGPAGLTAAAQLARRGFQVTIFESLPLAGGVLRYGIPEFRLPREILETELQDLKNSGIEIRTNTHIGQTISLSELSKQGFSATLLTIGGGAPKFSDLPGTQFAGVYYAPELLIPFNLSSLSAAKKQLPFPLGRKVIVVGTSSAALDVARVCRRLEREVTCVLPMTEEDLNAYPADLIQAREEGVEIESLTTPLEILGSD